MKNEKGKMKIIEMLDRVMELASQDEPLTLFYYELIADGDES